MASKILKTSEEEEDDDRLSALPDGVISHILSFLPTEFAATTSVLSKRWRSLFHSVAHIDLVEAWQMYPQDGRIRHRWLFHEFVYRLLLSPESSHIESFRLRCKTLHESEPINAWILAAIRRHVEELDLLVPLRRYETLPFEIFNSKTLRILKIRGQFIFDVPSSVHMPNLVDLYLVRARFVDGNCFRRGFPLLKHLRLCVCGMTGCDPVLDLVSQSLTSLILHRSYEHHKIALQTPNLEYLEYSAYFKGFLIVKEKLSRLTRADVDFKVEIIRPGPQTEKALAYGKYVKKFIKEIHNVKSLRLSGTSLEALCYSPCPWPTFHNLTTMELGVNHRVGWKSLAKLLECSPNLEVLNFDQGFIDRRSNRLEFEYLLNFDQRFIDRRSNRLEFEYCLPGIVPICLLEHLREIKVADFCGKKCEFELVEYFLRRGKVLKEIKICSQTFWGWPSSFCERLLKYRRSSKTCKIVLCWKADENWFTRYIN